MTDIAYSHETQLDSLHITFEKVLDGKPGE